MCVLKRVGFVAHKGDVPTGFRTPNNRGIIVGLIAVKQGTAPHPLNDVERHLDREIHLRIRTRRDNCGERRQRRACGHVSRSTDRRAICNCRRIERAVSSATSAPAPAPVGAFRHRTRAFTVVQRSRVNHDSHDGVGNVNFRWVPCWRTEGETDMVGDATAEEPARKPNITELRGLLSEPEAAWKGMVALNAAELSVVSALLEEAIEACEHAAAPGSHYSLNRLMRLSARCDEVVAGKAATAPTW